MTNNNTNTLTRDDLEHLEPGELLLDSNGDKWIFDDHDGFIWRVVQYDDFGDVTAVCDPDAPTALLDNGLTVWRAENN